MCPKKIITKSNSVKRRIEVQEGKIILVHQERCAVLNDASGVDEQHQVLFDDEELVPSLASDESSHSGTSSASSVVVLRVEHYLALFLSHSCALAEDSESYATDPNEFIARGDIVHHEAGIVVRNKRGRPTKKKAIESKDSKSSPCAPVPYAYGDLRTGTCADVTSPIPAPANHSTDVSRSLFEERFAAISATSSDRLKSILSRRLFAEFECPK